MPEPEGDLIADLDRLLNELIQRVTRDVLSVVKGKVTPSQFTVLRFIRLAGRSTVTAVAGGLQMTLSGVTALTDRLVEAGLVERTRDEEDRRIVWLDLTDKGWELSLELDGLKRGLIKQYVGGLQDSEITALNAILAKILRS